MITGSLVAIVTPMHEDGALDFAALQAPDRLAHRRRHRRHRRRRHHRRVADGRRRRALRAHPRRRRARRGPRADHRRHRRQFHARGDRAAEYAKKAGADCMPVGRALLQQADAGRPLPPLPAIAEAVDLPMILYNVPGRTVADMQNETVLRLAQVPGIVGIKEATGNIERGADLMRARAEELRDLHRRRRHRPRADAARRPRRDLGHRQRRAAPDARDVRGGARRRRRAARASSTTGCCRCTATCSSRRTRSRSSGRCAQLGLIEGGIRLPLTPLSAAAITSRCARRCARPACCRRAACGSWKEARHEESMRSGSSSCSLCRRSSPAAARSARCSSRKKVDYK